MASTSTQSSDIAYSLRVALATSVCLVLVAWLHLYHGNLAVWTTFMVMVTYQFTAFQKGVERILGRGLGIVIALLILVLCRDALALSLFLEGLAILVFFYVYFSGELAYTFLNAGLYLGVILEIGRHEPATVVSHAQEMALAIVVGVLVADLVSWLWGAESSLAITPGGSPLWPVRALPISRSLMLIVTLVLTLTVAHFFNMPTSTTIVSVMMLTVAADLQALLLKGELRLVGALLGGGFGLFTFMLVNRVPHFPVMVGMLFLGIFLATYIARTAGAYAYAGVQMGLVFPLVVVVPGREFGDVNSAFGRIEGAIIALAASLLVAMVWKRIELRLLSVQAREV